MKDKIKKTNGMKTKLLKKTQNDLAFKNKTIRQQYHSLFEQFM